ncbi:hypothetical protein BLOT_012010 [Blomia tropicalis]|nr:hypothetical protein BLOT_012010 [Blomia tropicalis]
MNFLRTSLRFLVNQNPFPIESFNWKVYLFNNCKEKVKNKFKQPSIVINPFRGWNGIDINPIFYVTPIAIVCDEYYKYYKLVSKARTAEPKIIDVLNGLNKKPQLEQPILSETDTEKTSVLMTIITEKFNNHIEKYYPKAVSTMESVMEKLEKELNIAVDQIIAQLPDIIEEIRHYLIIYCKKYLPILEEMFYELLHAFLVFLDQLYIELCAILTEFIYDMAVLLQRIFSTIDLLSNVNVRKCYENIKFIIEKFIESLNGLIAPTIIIMNDIGWLIWKGTKNSFVSFYQVTLGNVLKSEGIETNSSEENNEKR